MHTLGDMAKALNRSPVYLAGLQKRFELPGFEGAAYSEAYVAFLRALIALCNFGIAESPLLRPRLASARPARLEQVLG